MSGTALFALFACMHFDAGIGWWTVGFLCLVLDSTTVK